LVVNRIAFIDPAVAVRIVCGQVGKAVAAAGAEQLRARIDFAVAISIGLTTEKVNRQRPTAITVAIEIGEMTATKGMTKRKAINAVARRHGMAPNEIYELAEEAKKSGA